MNNYFFSASFFAPCGVIVPFNFLPPVTSNVPISKSVLLEIKINPGKLCDARVKLFGYFINFFIKSTNPSKLF
jgi:hypothetical protein